MDDGSGGCWNGSEGEGRKILQTLKHTLVSIGDIFKGQMK